MKKSVLIFLMGLVALILLVFLFCSFNAPVFETVPFTVVTDPTTLPKNVQTILEQIKFVRGYVVVNNFIVVCAGQKPTGGYSIAVTKIKKHKNVVKEKEPAKNDIVIQMVTYPYVIVKIDEALGGISFKVLDANGTAFSQIISTRGGVIDTTAIEVKRPSASDKFDVASVFQLPEWL